MVHRIPVALALSLPGVLLTALLYSPLSSIEERITQLKYHVRGERQADTNIVLVYLDNEAVGSLGSPLKRNFYALMVKALSDLQVKAIGIEVLFEGRNLEYMEYDELLASVVADSRKVVLTSYLGRMGESVPQDQTNASLPASLAFPHVNNEVPVGSELHMPFNQLASSSSGIGHVNLVDDSNVPVFIRADNSVVPSFGMELLRVYSGASRKDVSYLKNRVVIEGKEQRFEFSTEPEGIIRLDFPGSARSFTAYPFLEVLKSYDALRSKLHPRVPVGTLRDKIVLVGFIAEGQGAPAVRTPVDPRFPSLALHGTFLDNALNGRFQSEAPRWLVYVLCFLVGAICSFGIVAIPPPSSRILPVGILAGCAILSIVSFTSAGHVLPLIPLALAGVVSSIAGLFYEHQFMRRQVGVLQAEKDSISAQLRDREAKVAVLERELLDFEAKKSDDRTKELIEEIRRYKAEIRALTSKADDMEEFQISQEDVKEEGDVYEGIVYDRSGKMRQVIEFISKIAPSDAPVLILGESGTGKELVARAIHKRSGRGARQFLPVNCGALSETLLESELFGHEKGAFTGAVKDKPGRFELADGGTILLDEIGEVSESFQLKLLRVLQEGELERVGGTTTIKVNVRVVAATNRDLRESVNAKKFREDLYYRLNVLSVEIPPLRERIEDIPLLVEYFLRREGEGLRVSRNVMEAFRSYGWRGNVREMESAIKHAALFAKADGRAMVNVKDLTEEISAALRSAVAVEDQVLESIREKRFSRSAISDTAEDLGGLNRGTVAEYLRGECLKAFAENSFDLEKAILHISLTSDSEINDRVRRKLGEYLTNLSEVIDTSQPWEVSKSALKPKSKNLPQRYHSYLEKAAEAYFRGIWKPDGWFSA